MTKNKGSRKLRRLRSESEVFAAALSDPDAQPLTPADFQRMKRTLRTKVIRAGVQRALPRG